MVSWLPNNVAVDLTFCVLKDNQEVGGEAASSEAASVMHQHVLFVQW